MLVPPGNSDFTFHHWNGASTPNIKDLSAELTTLEHHKLSTITDRTKQFPQRVSLDDFTITLNVQSFASHFPDVSPNPVVTSKEILALRVTWMDTDETVPVEGYKCITQFKR
jgi:hypothetical protein